MIENLMSAGDLTEETVVCVMCGETLPLSQSLHSDAFGRICYFCDVEQDEDLGDIQEDWDDEFDDAEWEDVD